MATNHIDNFSSITTTEHQCRWVPKNFFLFTILAELCWHFFATSLAVGWKWASRWCERWVFLSVDCKLCQSLCQFPPLVGQQCVYNIIVFPLSTLLSPLCITLWSITLWQCVCQLWALSPKTEQHSLVDCLKAVQMESHLSEWLIDLLPLIVIRMLFCSYLSFFHWSSFLLDCFLPMLSCLSVHSQPSDWFASSSSTYSSQSSALIWGISILPHGDEASCVASELGLTLPTDFLSFPSCCTCLTAGLLSCRNWRRGVVSWCVCVHSFTPSRHIAPR